MADILRFPVFRHLRAEPRSHVLYFRNGKLVRSGRGASFWFRPLVAGIAEVPVDDREQSFHFTGKARDFQEVTVQGTVTYRVVDPEAVAQRIDFGIDLTTGQYLRKPLEKLANLVTQLIQQVALDYLTHESLRTVLQDGVQVVRERVEGRLSSDDSELAGMGLELVSVRVAQIAAVSDVDKALQAPTREAIQQEADEATFQRRALAVEKERAIAENELQNKIELARREKQLIEQEGENARRLAEEEAEAGRVALAAETERTRLSSDANADGIRAVEGARNEAEKERIEVYRDLPIRVLLGLAAREFAGKVESIDHLNLAPDALGPMLQSLLAAGTERLKEA